MASALSLGFGVQGVCLHIMRDGLWGGWGGGGVFIVSGSLLKISLKLYDTKIPSQRMCHSDFQ